MQFNGLSHRHVMFPMLLKQEASNVIVYIELTYTKLNMFFMNEEEESYANLLVVFLAYRKSLCVRFLFNLHLASGSKQEKKDPHRFFPFTTFSLV